MNYIEAITILEVDQHCSIEEVEKSYKALASKHHPDKGGENEFMVKLNDARDVLVSHLSASNLPSVFKQLELSVLNMNIAAQEQRAIQKKVEKIEKEIKSTATSKLISMKNTALVLAAISAGAFFLGKQIPKDVLTGFMPEAIEKPVKVELPEATELVNKYLSAKVEVRKKENEELTELINQLEQDKEVRDYLSNQSKYDNYFYEQQRFELHQEKISQYTFMWHLLTFGFGLYAGGGAWFLNRKIHRIEENLAEITDDLTIKSQYAEYLQEIFGDDPYHQWTLKELEKRIYEAKFYNRPLSLVIRNIGHKKMAQLFIAKGQESSFIQVEHGDSENNYQEVFRIS